MVLAGGMPLLRVAEEQLAFKKELLGTSHLYPQKCMAVSLWGTLRMRLLVTHTSKDLPIRKDPLEKGM